jgi:MFS family permease
MELHGRLGALAERNFRLVFSSTTISALGDGVTTVALAFAVLHISHNSATAVGLVIAARQASAAAITVAAGVWADRLPRHLVLVAAATVQGAVQAVAGTLIVTGHATVWMLVVLGFLFGLADGFVIPTSQGLIPIVVSATRLQEANALLGLSRSILGFLGPALGGVLVAVGSPGGAILVDAASFGAAALLLLRVSIPARADHVEPEPFFEELRAGWKEFRRQTWIWTTIVFFGIGNFASMSIVVLGPLVMKQHYGGSTTWGFVLGSFSGGTILGGLIAMRYRPSRPLLISCVAATPLVLQPTAIALHLPVAVLILIAIVSGIGLAIHLALWFTVFQRHVPEESRSRVSSYDALGSFVLLPVGSAIAGPIAAVIGITATLIGTSLVEVVCFAAIIAQPSVWAIRADPAPPRGLVQEAA